MTSQELAALPVGTRIRFDLRPWWSDEDDRPDIDPEAYGYDYGEIERTGQFVVIKWDKDRNGNNFPSHTNIDTNGKSWASFIAEISLAPQEF